MKSKNSKCRNSKCRRKERDRKLNNKIGEENSLLQEKKIGNGYKKIDQIEF